MATNLVEDVVDLLPTKIGWILLSGFWGEFENVSANQRPGRPSCVSDRPEKHKLCRGRWYIASCQVLLNSVKRFLGRSRKCLSQWFQREVENISANQRLGRPSCFSDRPKTPHKFGRGGWDLASCQVSLNSVQWFQREVENISANQRPGRPSCFSDRPKNTNLVEDV